MLKSLLSKLAYPITKPSGALMNLLFQNVAKKFLSSFLKALIAVGIAALSAVAGLDPVAIIAAAGAKLPPELVLSAWGVVVAFLTACISGLKRLATYNPAKDK